MLQKTGSKSHECKVEYSETEVSTVKLTYTDDQGTSYKATGTLTTTIGKENFTWGGITTGQDGGSGGGQDDDPNVNSKVAEINSKIGTVVNGYNAQSLEWQIFYADQSETFLISKTYATSSIFPIPLKGVDKQQEYEGSKDVKASSYGLKWNSKWLAKCTTESEDSNAKATAYLCDSNNWKSYVQSPATYAVGGPTLELFIASWNKSQNTNLSLVDDEIDKDGYVADKPEELYTSWPINSNIKNGAYYVTNSTSNYNNDYWLASPCGSYDLGNVFCIQERYDGTGRIYSTFRGDFQGQNCKIRPIVSIPTSKINVSGDTVTVLP